MTYPRVSEILAAVGLGPDYADVPPSVLEAAQRRGSTFDRLAEAAHYQYLDEAEVTPEVAPYWGGYQKFLAESGHTPIASQFEVHSARWRFVGHPDRLGWLQNHRALLDWKCVATLQPLPTMRQLAAYRLAINEMQPMTPVSLVAAVQFRSDGTYRVHEFTAADLARAESEFLAGLTVWHAKERR